MKIRSALLTACLLCAPGSLLAQTTLVNWNQQWNYLHPTSGTLPARSGTTNLHPNGTTPWFADQATFDASYRGPSFAAPGAGYDAGTGVGPLGYGAITYMTTPLPPPAEFTAYGTTLTTPLTGQRYTAYFRTTFTVPNDGKIYDNPTIRYLFDDGGFVYLDGVLVLRVNIATGLNDDFLTLAANTANTESHIREGRLDLPIGSSTGANVEVAPAIAGNATVVQRVSSLAPGVHTLAVALHNQANGSSDQIMALQMQAGQADCSLAASVSDITRDQNGTPLNPADDTIDFMVNVVPTGIFGATWEINSPVGSAALGQGGAYNTDVAITGIPIAEFGGVSAGFTVVDSVDSFCSTRINVFPPRVMATDDRAGDRIPVTTTGAAPNTGWVMNDAARTMVMNNGGGGARQVVTSEILDLSTSHDVLFTGTLEIDDSSSGNEADDSFLAVLIIDGDTLNPINLITPHDTSGDGLLTNGELAPSPGLYPLELSALIPATASSVQIVIEGINNSNSEIFTVRDLLFSKPPRAERLFLDVKPDGNNLVLTWEGRTGKLYNIRSETGLANPPLSWPIFGGNAGMLATPPFNTLTIPRPVDSERFFVVESFNAPPESVFDDNFESGLGGWTVGSEGALGTVWELGAPTSGPGAANSPTNCFATNLAGDYTPNAVVWLRSPAIDLTTAGSATLNYSHFYDIETGFDFGTISILNAADNSVLAVVQDVLDDFNIDWEDVSQAIPAAALGNSVKVEFRLTTDDVGELVGWYLDDVEVTVP